MNKFKKAISILLILSLSLGLFTGCSQGTGVKFIAKKGNEKVKIGIVQPVEHPSLNQIRESIISNLKEMGLEDKIEIVYKDAQGDPSNLNTIVTQFVGEEMDIIVPIGTGAAQSALAATKNIPIIFAAASYPVEAGLVKDVNKPEANITGVSDAIDVNEIFNLAKTLTPNVRIYGFIYNSGEVNSVSAVEKAKEYCEANKLYYVEATITNSSELLQATQSLVGKADAIFTPTDNTVASAMSTLAAEATKAGIPVYTGADSMVKDGGFATVGVDYDILGKQVAEMIKKVIDSESIANIPVQTLTEYTKIINTTTSEQLGISVSEEKLKEFQVIK